MRFEFYERIRIVEKFIKQLEKVENKSWNDYSLLMRKFSMQCQKVSPCFGNTFFIVP